MKRSQLERLYRINGLEDYKLKNSIDLLKTHGIDYTEADGYNRLDDLNRQLYEKFIINFFNAQGLESRAGITVKGIFFVEDYELLVKENPADDYFNVAGGVVLAIDRNGMKTIHKTWYDENYAHLKTEEDKHKMYLRFEYEHYGSPTWLHVVSPDEWY